LIINEHRTDAVARRFETLRPTEAAWAWQLAARCRTTDPEVFFHPEHERAGARRRRQQKAKRICADCPVRDACRTAAIRNREGYGVWGGMSEDERSALLFAARRGGHHTARRSPKFSASH
jgi:WhiB family redox-sensing transcriptional regulator